MEQVAREVEEATSLEVLKVKFHMALSNTNYWKMPLATAVGAH